jgi:hypothetical protein
MAVASGNDNLEEDFDREGSLGWTVDERITATKYKNCDRKLAAVLGRGLFRLHTTDRRPTKRPIIRPSRRCRQHVI